MNRRTFFKRIGGLAVCTALHPVIIPDTFGGGGVIELTQAEHLQGSIHARLLRNEPWKMPLDALLRKVQAKGLRERGPRQIHEFEVIEPCRVIYNP